MRSLDTVQEVTIVGLGKTGIGLSRLLHTLGKRVRITEKKAAAASAKDFSKVRDIVADAEFEGHTRDFVTKSGLILVSPSVPLHSEIFSWAAEECIPVMGEIELCSQLCPAPIAAVTGSIGKTTTTSLLFKILKKHSGKKTHLLGNIGIPFSEFVLEVKKDDIVCLEVSSYQLATIQTFKPHVAVLLNIVPNHLDVHAHYEEYVACKLNIFKNQTEQDFALINEYDKDRLPGIEHIRAQKLFFSGNGFRNEDFSAAVAAATALGISEKQAQEVIGTFKGLPHRLEYVATIEGVDFINDSKSTTVESTAWALRQIEKPVWLICGGRDKGLSYETLAPALSRVKAVFIIGEAGEKIFNALPETARKRKLSTLDEAVAAARKSAEPGDAVLLSCMCSSFDMFKDYKERGNVFKRLVSGGTARPE